MRFFKKSEKDDGQPPDAEPGDGSSPGDAEPGNGPPPEAVRGDGPADILAALTAVVDGLPGLVGAAVVDDEAGAVLATGGHGDVDLATASAGHLEVWRAERDVLAMLGLEDQIEDVLISLRTQYHLIVPLARTGLLLCVVVDRDRGNLGLARHHLRSIETETAPRATE